MKARVTQTDIARVAGVHNTTVSLALRNCPAIPEPTRKRIQAIAGEMGYFPDPALQALVAYRNGRTRCRRQETIAYVTNWTSRWGWQELPGHAKFYVGAQRQAAQSGFHLEHFWLGEPDMTQRRLRDILFNRGITGAILASHRADGDAWQKMDWSRLSAIKIGCFPHAPALHRVTEDQSGNIRLAMKRIVAAGYERIGLVMPYWCDDFADQGWSAGFLAEQYRLPDENRVPVLWYGSRWDRSSYAVARGDEAIDLAALANWFVQHRPEAIVSLAPFVRRQIDRLGLSVPSDVAYVDLFVEGSESGMSGVRENCERVGEVAAELLIALMRQNSCGLPVVATATLVEGTWVDGASLPHLRPATRWSDDLEAPTANDDKTLISVL